MASAALVGAAAATVTVTIPAGKPAALTRARWWLERGEAGVGEAAGSPSLVRAQGADERRGSPDTWRASQDALGYVLMEPSDGEPRVRAPESVLGDQT